jgi:hypothetical protein
MTPIVCASPRWYPSEDVMGPSVAFSRSVESPSSTERSSFPVHVLHGRDPGHLLLGVALPLGLDLCR